MIPKMIFRARFNLKDADLEKAFHSKERNVLTMVNSCIVDGRTCDAIKIGRSLKKTEFLKFFYFNGLCGEER